MKRLWSFLKVALQVLRPRADVPQLSEVSLINLAAAVGLCRGTDDRILGLEPGDVLRPEVVLQINLLFLKVAEKQRQALVNSANQIADEAETRFMQRHFGLGSEVEIK